MLSFGRREIGHVSQVPTSSRVGAWAVIAGQASGTKLHSSFNISSVTRNGAGDYSLTYTSGFASASDYVIVGGLQLTRAQINVSNTTLPAAGSCRVLTLVPTGPTLTDTDPTTVVCIGRL